MSAFLWRWTSPFTDDSVGQDVEPLGFAGISEFSGRDFRKHMAENKHYTCTVPCHWLGLHDFSHAGLWPSFGNILRVFEQTLMDPRGNLDPSGMFNLRVRVRSKSEAGAPAIGEHEFVDGDVGRLALALAAVRSRRSGTDAAVADAFSRCLRPALPLPRRAPIAMMHALWISTDCWLF